MNTIFIDQNAPKQLHRLAAQRQLYSKAKIIFGWQVILGGPVAVVSAIWLLIDPSIKGYVAAWGLLVLLCDVLWLTPWIKRIRHRAATIQEAFDCDVLVLPWNSVKAGKQPDPELVKEQSDNYQKRASRMPALENWYPEAVATLPLHIARLACQRANCWWDGKQRRQYAVWIISSVLLTFAMVFALSLKGGLTIEDFVLKVVVPLGPALLLGIRQYKEQTEAATRLDKLKEHAESVWTESLASKSSDDVVLLSRSLQDEILENRRNSPFVPDRVFKWLRGGYETQMQYAVAEHVAEAQKSMMRHD